MNFNGREHKKQIFLHFNHPLMDKLLSYGMIFKKKGLSEHLQHHLKKKKNH